MNAFFEHHQDNIRLAYGCFDRLLLNGLIQPFLNYNFEGGTYLTSSPILTVNWSASGSNQWTVPIGGGIGHIFHFGKLPVNTQISAYYNVVKPDFGPNWQIRAQVQFMFPK